MKKRIEDHYLWVRLTGTAGEKYMVRVYRSGKTMKVMRENLSAFTYRREGHEGWHWSEAKDGWLMRMGLMDATARSVEELSRGGATITDFGGNAAWIRVVVDPGSCAEWKEIADGVRDGSDEKAIARIRWLAQQMVSMRALSGVDAGSAEVEVL